MARIDAPKTDRKALPKPPKPSGLTQEEATLLRSALEDLEQATLSDLKKTSGTPASRFLTKLDFLGKVWNIEVDFYREEGNRRSEAWYRHFEEINRRWNIRYAPPRVSGPDDEEAHARLLARLHRVEAAQSMALDYEPTSHRRLLGRPIVWLKRLFSHLLEPYLERVLELIHTESTKRLEFQEISAALHRETIQTLLFKRQADFNAEVVRLLNELTHYVLFVRQKRFNQETKALLEGIPVQLEQLYESLTQRLDLMEETVAASRVGSQKPSDVEGLLLRLEQLLSDLKRDAGQEGAPPKPQDGLDHLRDHRYHEFEDLFRGSREEIIRRQRRYIGYFFGCQRVVDLGCGRGEFLELCNCFGVGAVGIDINSEMIRICRERELEATEADIISWLSAQPDGSLDGIFSAQVIEHLEKDLLIELLRLSRLKLKPGSYLILETLNTDNLVVGASRFYADITHVRPIPSSTLEFLAKSLDFRETFVLYSSPVPDGAKLEQVPIESSSGEERWKWEIINGNFAKLNELLFTYQDYALVARRPPSQAGESLP